MQFQLSLESESARSTYPESPVAVDQGVSTADVIRLMQAERAGVVLVCEGNDLVGIFTERDVLKLMAEQTDLEKPITTFMISDPVTVSEKETVGETIRKMSEGGYRHLPLVDVDDPKKPLGMIDVRGIVHYLVEHFPDAIYNLPPNPQQKPTEREGA